jgi:hypothetical protein
MTTILVDAACKMPRLATHVLLARATLADDPALDALDAEQEELLVSRIRLRALSKDVDTRCLATALR